MDVQRAAVRRGARASTSGVRWASALLAVTLAPVGQARADDTADLEGLLNEPVVATASRAAESSSDAPATSSSISADDLRRYGIRSLDEAINFLALGMITQNPLHSVEIGGRGVLLTSDYGNHVLLLVDGHVLNEPWNGTAYFEQGAGIPLELIDHIEIVLGPGSVLYGSNAMLGVVNIVTKRARDYDGIHAVAEGSLSPSTNRAGSIPSFAASELGRTYRLGVGLGQRFKLFRTDAELTAHAEYYDQSGPAFAWGPQVLADNPTKNFGPRAPQGTWGGTTRDGYFTRVPSAYGRLVLGDFELALRAASYQRATPYLNGMNQSIGDFDDPNNYEVDRWLSFDAKYLKRLTEAFSISVRLYGDTYDYRQRLTLSDTTDCPVPSGGRACVQDNVGASRWLGSEFQATVGDSVLNALLGVDGRIRYVGSKTDARDLTTQSSFGTQAPYHQSDAVLGTYAQGRAKYRSWLQANAGARVDIDTRVGSKLSPRATVVLQPREATSIKLIYAEAFRAPTAYELYYEYPSIQLAPRDLRPESVRSIEASAEQKFGSQRLLVGAFRSWWRDMIALETVEGGLQQLQNVSAITNYGINAAFDGSVLPLRYGATFTAAVAEREGGTPLTVAPKIFGNAHVSYELPAGWPTLALAASMVGRRPADRAFDGGFSPTPYAPAQLNVRGTLTGPFPRVPGLSYRLMADWVSPGRSPYVAGPVQAAPAAPDGSPGPSTAAELAPVTHLTVLGGLQLEVMP